MKRYLFCVLMLFPSFAMAQGQKITIPVVDTCGFIVKNTVNITATVAANSPVTVSQIVLDVDGMPIGMPLTMPPFTTPWDTHMVSNGCHTVTATVSDSSGNSVTVPIPLAVRNK